MLNIFKNSNKVDNTISTLPVLNDDNLMIKQFNDLNIVIYGTYEEPLFKAKDIGDLLGIKNVKDAIKNYNDKQKSGVVLTDPHGRPQETNMLTEQGLYKMLMRSRKKIAEQFQDWVCEVVEEIRKKGKYDLEEQLQAKELELQAKEQELVRYKEKTYEEIQKNNHVYVIKTDGGYKVGKTRDINNRIRGLQTGNVRDIEVVLDFKTSNSDLLERVVHYILDRYRCNSNREFFDCDIDYIKNVVTVLGYTIDTLKSTYQHISKDDLVIKLQENVNIDRSNLPEYTEPMGSSLVRYTNLTIEPNRISTFHNWLDENIIYKENSILKSTIVVESFLGKPMGHKKKEINKYKNEIEKFIKRKFKSVKCEWGKLRIDDNHTISGWRHLCIKN